MGEGWSTVRISKGEKIMKQYAVPEKLVNSILNYLGSKAYIEVAPLIGALGQIQEIPPAPLAVVPSENKGE